MKRLSLNQWLNALVLLNRTAADTTSDSSDSEASMLRALYRLLCTAPCGSYDPSTVIDEAELETMLDSGAFESAALRTISPFMGYMISQPPGMQSDIIASVWLPNNKEEITSSGSTTACAIVIAATAALHDAHELNQTTRRNRHMH